MIRISHSTGIHVFCVPLYWDGYQNWLKAQTHLEQFSAASTDFNPTWRNEPWLPVTIASADRGCCDASAKLSQSSFKVIKEMNLWLELQPPSAKRFKVEGSRRWDFHQGVKIGLMLVNKWEKTLWTRWRSVKSEERRSSVVHYRFPADLSTISIADLRPFLNTLRCCTSRITVSFNTMQQHVRWVWSRSWHTACVTCSILDNFLLKCSLGAFGAPFKLPSRSLECLNCPATPSHLWFQLRLYPVEPSGVYWCMFSLHSL